LTLRLHKCKGKIKILKGVFLKMKVKKLLTMMLAIAIVATLFTAVFTVGVAAAGTEITISPGQNGGAHGNLVIDWYGGFTTDIYTGGDWTGHTYDPALDTGNEGITVTVAPEDDWLLDQIRIMDNAAGGWDEKASLTSADLDENNQLVITNDMLAEWGSNSICLWVSWKLSPDAPILDDTPADLADGWTWVSGRDTDAINYCAGIGTNPDWNEWALSNAFPRNTFSAHGIAMNNPTMIIWTNYGAGNYVAPDTLLCTFNFTGVGVNYYSVKNNNRRANIKIDVVDEYGTTVDSQSFIYTDNYNNPQIYYTPVTGLPYGDYTVKIWSLADLDPNGGGIATVQGFAYDPGTSSDPIVTPGLVFPDTNDFTIDGGTVVSGETSVIAFGTVANLVAGTNYTYGVYVYDAAGNWVDCQSDNIVGLTNGSQFGIRIYGPALVSGTYTVKTYVSDGTTIFVSEPGVQVIIP